MRDGPELSWEGVERRFGRLLAVDDLTLEVESGEMFGLIGPDGAGKTTTLRLALGLLSPNRGRVRTCGLDPVRQRVRLSRRVGYLAQTFSLYGDLSVDENMAFFAALHGVRGWRARRDHLLGTLRLEPFRGRLADRLSGGMRQKLALACTLLHTPHLLVMDEPTRGIDPVSRREFWKILEDLRRGGMTIVMSTPYLDEAERCGRVGLMDRGRLLTVDAPEQLREDWQGVMVEVSARPKRRAAELLRSMAEVSEVEVFGERLHVSLRGAARATAGETAARLARELGGRGVEVQAARPVPPSLEDVFIARVRAAADGPPPGR